MKLDSGLAMFGFAPTEILLFGFLAALVLLRLAMWFVNDLRKQSNVNANSVLVSQLKQENQRLRDKLAAGEKASES